MITINWKGPFSWPKFEDKNGLPSIPDSEGVYIQSFEYKQGYLIYSVGITGREIQARLKEHTREYMKGGYNVFDMNKMESGIRKSIWQGWKWTEEKEADFKKNKLKIQNKVERQLSRSRVFVGNIGDDPRLRERLEAKVMNSIYHSDYPYSEIPDKGMKLLPKRDDENAIPIHNICDKALFGLPVAFEI